MTEKTSPPELRIPEIQDNQWSMIIRLEERQKNVEVDVKELKEAISKFIDTVGTHYVRKEEFSPVQKVVFATISIIITSVMATAIGSIIYVK
jgi:hypothetical protein